MYKKILKTLLLTTLFNITYGTINAQSEVIPVWPDGAPGAIADPQYMEESQMDALGQIRGYSQVSRSVLSVYLADSTKATGTSVVISPGGGYSHLAIDKEGYKVAEWLNTLGISAFVLKYRLPNDKIMKDKTVGPLQDAQEAVRIVRRNAEKWHLEPNKVGIMGFSAGGHLASTLSTHYGDNIYPHSGKISARPDFSILVYPVVSMKDGVTHQGSKKSLLGENPTLESIEKYSNAKQVDSLTPPTFLLAATDDQVVPVENSIEYYLALKNHNIPAEMHLYENGGHGFVLGTSGTNQFWPTDCENWLRAEGWIPKKEVFLFSYFKGNGEDGLHLAYSEDGYEWKALKDDTPLLGPEVGKDKLMRDPCIIKGGDGNYHMVWTVSWTDKGIGYASSKDLIHWSEQRFIPVMAQEKGTRNSWAPEITFDHDTGTYMIYWSSTVEGKFPETKSDKENGYNHRIYYTTTKDFQSFSGTKLLYDPGFNVIDATIKKYKGKFVMFLKDETTEPAEKNIKIAYSDRLEGPYGKAGMPITGDYWAEGPTASLVDGKFIVYFDKYRDKKYGAVSSSDLKNWTDISEMITFPDGARHGTVFTVPRSVFLALDAVR
jgi:acetyl esterase/lipase